MTYREGPASKKRVRCQRHFLAYDPSVASGCVLCRRGEEGGRPVLRPTAILYGLVLAALVGFSIHGAVNLARSFMPRAMPGEPCSAQRGCVEGYDCLAFGSGLLPPVGATRGRCTKSCTGDADCTAPERCVDRGPGLHCGLVARAGEACGREVSCEDDAECLSPLDRPSKGRCRRRCDPYDRPCPAGQVCTPIVTSTSPALPPLDLPGGPRRYCVDARP